MQDFVRAGSDPLLAAKTDVDLPPISADEALRRLVAGNIRFFRGETLPRAPLRESRTELAKDQRPFATILGCSDSRVAPELIFDAGLGDLFVVRVAGNVFSPEVASSLQYAGAQLHTPLFVVLGHDQCGAVNAALKARDEGKRHRTYIQLLVNTILPALPKFDRRLSSEARLAQAVESNVRWTVRTILKSPEGQIRQAEGLMKVVGGVYEIERGLVRFLI